MSDAQFYYEINGQQAGPITAPQLKAMATSGELKPTDMVWKDGLPDWVQAGTIRGLFPEGTPVPPPMNTGAGTAGDVGRQAAAAARETAQQSLGAIKILLSDPVGGLGKAYETLGPSKALPVGIAFLAVYLLCYLIAGIFAWMAVAFVPWNSIQLMLASSHSIGGFTARAYFLGILYLIVSVGTLIGLCLLFRLMARSTASISADLFVVGSALLPQGLCMLLMFILGGVFKSGWFTDALLLGVLIVGHSIMIFIMFSGLTKVLGLAERTATLMLPLMFFAQALMYMVVFNLIPPIAAVQFAF